MSVFELLAPRKNWTDLNVSSINANTIIGNDMLEITPLNQVTTSPVSISASNWVNGIVKMTGSSQVINGPDLPELASYFGSSFVPGLTFTTSIYIQVLTRPITINGGTGTFFSQTGSPTLTINSTNTSGYLQLQYRYSGTHIDIFTGDPNKPP